MVLVALLLAIALVGVLGTSLLALATGPFDVVSIIGAVICVVAALAIAVEVLWVRADGQIEAGQSAPGASPENGVTEEVSAMPARTRLGPGGRKQDGPS